MDGRALQDDCDVNGVSCGGQGRCHYSPGLGNLSVLKKTAGFIPKISEKFTVYQEGVTINNIFI